MQLRSHKPPEVQSTGGREASYWDVYLYYCSKTGFCLIIETAFYALLAAVVNFKQQLALKCKYIVEFLLF